MQFYRLNTKENNLPLPVKNDTLGNITFKKTLTGGECEKVNNKKKKLILFLNVVVCNFIIFYYIICFNLINIF